MFGAQRPRLLVCYICGREYGSKSLPIHIPQCIKKWEDTEALKPPRERRRVPAPPVGLDPLSSMPVRGGDLDAFNEAMYQQFEEVSLCHCEFCGRSFNDEAFRKHKNLCTADRPFRPKGTGLGGGGMPLPPGAARSAAISPPRAAEAGAAAHLTAAAPKKAAPSDPGPAQRPLAYQCYICGCQFGSSSLHIHIPQCKKKWEATEESRGSYRSLPNEPADMPQTAAELPKTIEGIVNFNNRMSSHWSQISLVPCMGCGRTFKPEALEHHAHACKGTGPASSSLPPPASLYPAAASLSGTSSPPAKLPSAGQARGAAAAKGAGRATPRSAAASAGGMGTGRPPAGLTCYLCGSQFGSSSLRIHYAQCKAKWDAQEQLKPAQSRRACPLPPPELVGPLPSTAQGIETFNAIMFQEFNQRCLEACPGCGRTFKTEALEKHVKGCKGPPSRRS